MEEEIARGLAMRAIHATTALSLSAREQGSDSLSVGFLLGCYFTRRYPDMARGFLDFRMQFNAHAIDLPAEMLERDDGLEVAAEYIATGVYPG